MMETFVPSIETGSNDDVRGTVQNVLDTYQQVKDKPILLGLLSRELGDANRRMRDIRDGRFTVESEDLPQFMISALKSSTKSVHATSFARFDHWWASSFGSRYRETNIALRKQGVTVARVFIFTDQDEFARACPIIDEQRKNGIDVRIIVDPQGVQDGYEDVIIIDNNLAGSLDLSAERLVRRANFYTDSFTVNELERRYQRTLLESQEFMGCKK
jgi:hypothetical protein